MFVLRSAFWLSVGFVLVAPHGTDFGATATALKDQAVTAAAHAGEEIVAAQLLGKRYSSTALIDVFTSTPSVDLPVQVSPTAPAVFPRARPAAMG